MCEVVDLLSRLSLSAKSAVELCSLPNIREGNKDAKKNPDEDEYYLQIDEQDERLAVLCSSSKVRIFDSTSLIRVATLTGHVKTVTKVKFSHESPQVLFTSSCDGLVRLWDLRVGTEKEQTTYTVPSDSKKSVYQLLSLDVSCDDRIICAGTQLLNEDVFIHFWDVRKTVSVNSYEGVHSDDVTQVKFHSIKKDSLLTGSDDGLVNYMDISQTSEDDALQYTFNTEDAISNIGWSGNNLEAFGVSLDNSWFVWDCAEGDTNFKWCLKDFREIRGTKQRVDYLVECIPVKDKLCVMSGTDEGDAALFHLSDKSLKHCVSLESGHTKTIRACTWSNKTQCIYTVGEDALLCSWMSGQKQTSLDRVDKKSDKYDSKSKLKRETAMHRSKPYKR